MDPGDLDELRGQGLDDGAILEAVHVIGYFNHINRAALASLPALLARWLPGGVQAGTEYTARNPKRNDRNAGSFRVSTTTGRWADFATADRGGDPVSLAAFLSGKSQVEAARELAAMLGISEYE